MQSQRGNTFLAKKSWQILADFSGGSDGIIYNAIALVGFLAFFPALLLVILIQNHLSRGLTMGAVKG